MSDWASVQGIARTLPDSEETTSYGTPSFKRKRKMFCRLKEDGETLVVRCDRGERELLMGAAPERFFLTPHYEPYDYVLVRLPAMDAEELREVLTDSWESAGGRR